MYRIIQVENRWVVCFGQAMLISFHEEEMANRVAEDAEYLMKTAPASDPSSSLTWRLPATY